MNYRTIYRKVLATNWPKMHIISWNPQTQQMIFPEVDLTIKMFEHVRNGSRSFSARTFYNFFISWLPKLLPISLHIVTQRTVFETKISLTSCFRFYRNSPDLSAAPGYIRRSLCRAAESQHMSTFHDFRKDRKIWQTNSANTFSDNTKRIQDARRKMLPIWSRNLSEILQSTYWKTFF